VIAEVLPDALRWTTVLENGGSALHWRLQILSVKDRLIQIVILRDHAHLGSSGSKRVVEGSVISAEPATVVEEVHRLPLVRGRDLDETLAELARLMRCFLAGGPIGMESLAVLAQSRGHADFLGARCDHSILLPLCEEPARANQEADHFLFIGQPAEVLGLRSQVKSESS